jgi:hypothetical protein
VALLRLPVFVLRHPLEPRRESKAMKTVRVTVVGGLVQHVEVPEGVQVVVRDYDVDGTEADQLQQDENGDQFIESIWEHE